MSRGLRAGRTPQSAFTVGLLLLALALVAVLAWKAQQAARSHRATAERTLRDYASFAAWEYAQRARMNLLTTSVSSLLLPISRINPDDPTAMLPSPADFGEKVLERMRWCECMDSVRFFFRYDWRDSTFVSTAGPGMEAAARWARDTLVAHTRIFPTPTGLSPLAFGSTSGSGPLRRLSVILTNDAYVNVFRTIDGRARVVVYVLSRTTDGAPFATFGYESDAVTFARGSLAKVVDKERLLPPSLVGTLPNDSLLEVSVAQLDGDPLWRSSASFADTYAAVDTLDQGYGRLVVRVALNPALAERLVVGGLPRSQLPVLLGLVLLTAGLLVGALLQLRRQQQLARLRTDFVSGVSHELRTPLTQIRLFAELLHGDDLRSEAERRRAARVVDQEARRLTYLVENVLAFARSDRRMSHVAPELADVTAEARDTLELIAPVASARGSRLRAVFEDGVVARVDRNALRQVLLNLIDNAVKYGPVAQTITVGVRRLGSAVRIWVEDEGPGIPDGERERVFEPYHRLRRDAESAVGGSGIGLAVVHDLVLLHGGEVWVEGGTPRGTRVVLELPLDGPAGAAHANGDTTGAPGTYGSGDAGAGAARVQPGTAGAPPRDHDRARGRATHHRSTALDSAAPRDAYSTQAGERATRAAQVPADAVHDGSPTPHASPAAAPNGDGSRRED